MTDTSQHGEIDQFEDLVENAHLDDMLNTAGFVEFLARFPEGASNADDEEALVEKRFEVFQKKEAVKAEIKRVYADQIKHEMGFDLTDEDLSSVDAYIEDAALSDPEDILELNQKLMGLKQLPEQISSLEDQLNSLGDVEGLQIKIADLEQKKETIQVVKDNAYSLQGIANMFFDVGAVKKTWDAARMVKKDGIPIQIGSLNVAQMDLDQRIRDIRGALSDISVASRFKEKITSDYIGLRKDIIGGIGASAEIAAVLRKKAFEEIERLTLRQDFDTMQKRFEEFQKIAETSDTGVDVLEGVDVAEMQEMIDASIERGALEMIVDKINGLRLGDNSLAKMEKSLEDFLKKQKLGSKTGQDVKRFVGVSIDTAERTLGNSVQDKAKRILLARIKIKFKL
jgi:hypothetical protein